MSWCCYLPSFVQDLIVSVLFRRCAYLFTCCMRFTWYNVLQLWFPMFNSVDKVQVNISITPWLAHMHSLEFWRGASVKICLWHVGGGEGWGGKSYGAAMSITALLSVHLYYVCTTVSMYVNLLRSFFCFVACCVLVACLLTDFVCCVCLLLCQCIYSCSCFCACEQCCPFFLPT